MMKNENTANESTITYQRRMIAVKQAPGFDDNPLKSGNWIEVMG